MIFRRNVLLAYIALTNDLNDLYLQGLLFGLGLFFTRLVHQHVLSLSTHTATLLI